MTQNATPLPASQGLATKRGFEHELKSRSHMDSQQITASTSRTTASSSYANFPDACKLTAFQKRNSDSALFVAVSCDVFSSGGGDAVMFGVSIGGTDYDIRKGTLTTANAYRSVGGVRKITGIKAGTYDVTLRWKRLSGASNVTADTNSQLALTVTESF